MNGYLVNSLGFRDEVCTGFLKFDFHAINLRKKELILAHATALGEPAIGFFFKGVHYGDYVIGQKSKYLHKSLCDRGEQLLAEQSAAIRKSLSVSNFIVKSTNMTREESDLRILFPECLHQYLEAYCQKIGPPESRVKRSTPKALQDWYDQTHEIREKISSAFALHILIA